jgi:hypothetical protein
MNNHEQINETFEAVADYLTRSYEGNFTWRPNRTDWAPGGNLVCESLAIELYVRNADRGKPMYTIRGVSPKDSRGQLPYVAQGADASINVSRGKTVSQVGDAILTRLLPEWIPLLEKILDAIEQSNQYEDTVASTGREIARIVGTKYDPEHHRVSFYRSPHAILAETVGKAEVHGDDVNLELVLSHEDAISLLSYLTGR